MTPNSSALSSTSRNQGSSRTQHRQACPILSKAFRADRWKIGVWPSESSAWLLSCYTRANMPDWVRSWEDCDINFKDTLSTNVSPLPLFRLAPSREKECHAQSMQVFQVLPGWTLPTFHQPCFSWLFLHPITCNQVLAVEWIFPIPNLVLAALAQNFSPLWTSGSLNSAAWH